MEAASPNVNKVQNRVIAQLTSKTTVGRNRSGGEPPHIQPIHLGELPLGLRLKKSKMIRRIEESTVARVTTVMMAKKKKMKKRRQ